MATFNLENYATVQERIAQFYTENPDGSIRTRLVKLEGPVVVFEARVFRSPADVAAGVYSSGWAHELEGRTPVNKTSHVENCETSAIGRALANLGYATDANRPSRAEMLKVARQQAEHEAMIEYIRDGGKYVGPDAIATIGGKEVNVQEYVRRNWSAIKERHSLAAAVVTALEECGSVTFRAPEE